MKQHLCTDVAHGRSNNKGNDCQQACQFVRQIEDPVWRSNNPLIVPHIVSFRPVLRKTKETQSCVIQGDTKEVVKKIIQKKKNKRKITVDIKYISRKEVDQATKKSQFIEQPFKARPVSFSQSSSICDAFFLSLLCLWVLLCSSMFFFFPTFFIFDFHRTCGWDVLVLFVSGVFRVARYSSYLFVSIGHANMEMPDMVWNKKKTVTTALFLYKCNRKVLFS